MKASYESSEKALEIAKLLGSDSVKTSHYITIDNVLFRISNHLPDACYLNAYNNVEELDGVVFVFTTDTHFNFEAEIERTFGNDFNYEVVVLGMEDEFSMEDAKYYAKRVK
jgi:hypothetical protein